MEVSSSSGGSSPSGVLLPGRFGFVVVGRLAVVLPAVVPVVPPAGLVLPKQPESIKIKMSNLFNRDLN